MNRKIAIVLILPVILAIMHLNASRIRNFQQTESLNRMIGNPDIPASLAITTFALGPLRALVFDALWWRAIQQQDKGEYFDALQLTDWITTLQPTYASVWAYLAWNMSYNIAHDFANEEDRWEWIHRSIVLLRDKGLKYNPGNTVIRHELARIFYDRIGNNVDPAAEFFKNQWAFTMMTYLDTGMRQELLELQNSAASLAELRRRPEVAAYAEKLKAVGADIFDFQKNTPVYGWIEVDLPKEVKETAGIAIYYYYKRKKIEDELKMDIDRMLYIDREYGPLDWRLHQAHAIYWSAEDNFEDFMRSGVNYARIIRQSMMQAFYEGKLFHDSRKNIITRTNNLEIVGKIHDFVEYLLHHHYDSSINGVHKRFLESAVTILYTYNQIDGARELFEHYREDYLQESPVDFETFILRSLENTLISQEIPEAMRDRRSLIEVSVFQSFQWLAFGDNDRSNGYFNFAKLMWSQHQRRFQNDPGKLLPAFEQIVKSAKSKYLSSTSVTESTLTSRLNSARSTAPIKIDIGSFSDEHHHDHE